MRSIRSVLGLDRRPDRRPTRGADPEPPQEQEAALTNEQRLLFEAIKREFPFMSDECILQVISEM